MKKALRRLIVFVIVLSMFLSGLSLKAFAFSTQSKGKSNWVYIRVEGYNETIVPRRRILVDDFDLSTYMAKSDGGLPGGPTAVHALIKALEEEGIDCKNSRNLVVKSDNGLLNVSEVKNDKEKNNSNSAWIVRVDDEIQNHDYSLSDWDDIVWYYGVYGEDTVCSIINADATRINPGDFVNISLLGLKGKSKAKGKVDRATIYVDGAPYIRDGKAEETNSSGSARVKFEYPGNYALSAERFSGNKRDMVRPDPIMISVIGESELDEDLPLPSPAPSAPTVTPSPKRLQIYDELDTAISHLLFKVKDIQKKGYEDILDDATKVADLLKRASEVAANATTSADVVSRGNILIESMVEVSKRVKEEHNSEKMFKNALKALDATTAVIHQVSDEQIIPLVQQIIDTTGDLSQLNDQQSKVLTQKVTRLSQIAQESNAVMTISKQELVAKGKDVTCVMEEEDFDPVISKAFEIAEILDGTLAKNRFVSQDTLKGKIIIDIVARDKQRIKATFSEDTFDNLTRRGLKSVGIRTDLGQIFLTPDAFQRQGDQKNATIIISAGSLENSKGSFLPDSAVMSIEAQVDNDKIHSFEEPIEVRIPYIGDIDDMEKLKVFCIKGDGSIEAVEGEFDAVSNNVVFYTKYPGTFVVNKE